MHGCSCWKPEISDMKLPTIEIIIGLMLSHLYVTEVSSTSYNYYGNFNGEYETSCGGDVNVKAFEFVSASVPISSTTRHHVCEWRIRLDNSEEGPHLPLQLHVTKTDDKIQKINVFDGIDEFSEQLQPYAKAKYQASGTRLFLQVIYAPIPNQIFLFNATAKIKGYCPGMYSCGDGESCYRKDQRCDATLQCLETMADEQGCNGCKVDLFWCGVSDDPKLPLCFSEEQRCDHKKVCPFPYLDESDCTSCKPGTVLCNVSSSCIFEQSLCDGISNCKDGSDERNCQGNSTRRVITAAIIGSLVCGLLFVIALGFTCKLYSLRVSHQQRINSYRSTPLSRVERALFEREAPPTYDMTIEGRLTENSHTSSRRQRSRRYQFRRATPALLSNNNTLTSRDDGVENEPTPTVQQTNTMGSTHDRVTSLVLETNPNLISNLLFGGITNTADCTTEPTHSNCASANTNPSSSSRRQAVSRSRSEVSSRSRSSRRRSRRSRDVQAHKLPTKKRIAPVMVPAPHLSEAVEDTTTCLYPTPPSYDQVIIDSPMHDSDDYSSMNHSTSMPALHSEQSSSKSNENKVSFKNPISAIIKLTSPKHFTNSQTPRRKLFDFKLKTPSFFRSDPGYSRMDRTNSPHLINEMINQEQLNNSESSSDDEDILDVSPPHHDY